jgi:hypothetical protein
MWNAIESHNQKGIHCLDAVRVGDPPDLLQGATDPEVLVWAEREGRILVSGDRRTLLRHFADHLDAGRHSPGLFLLRPSTPLPKIIEFLAAVTYASDADEMSGVSFHKT